MKFNEFEDDGITPRDSFVLQRASGFEVHEFSTNRVGFSAENCQARQVCSAGNIVAVTGLDAKATYVERAKDLTLWIVQDGSLATKIPRAGYLPQVLRTGQNPGGERG